MVFPPQKQQGKHLEGRGQKAENRKRADMAKILKIDTCAVAVFSMFASFRFALKTFPDTTPILTIPSGRKHTQHASAPSLRFDKTRTSRHERTKRERQNQHRHTVARAARIPNLQKQASTEKALSEASPTFSAVDPDGLPTRQRGDVEERTDCPRVQDHLGFPVKHPPGLR